MKENVEQTGKKREKRKNGQENAVRNQDVGRQEHKTIEI